MSRAWEALVAAALATAAIKLWWDHRRRAAPFCPCCGFHRVSGHMRSCPYRQR